MNGSKGNENRYADLLDRERPKHDGDDFSRRHPPMPLEERAKIFLPFAALKGYEQTVEQRTILFEKEKGLSEDLMMEINDRLRVLKDRVEQGDKPRVRVRCFIRAEGIHEGEGQEVWLEDQCENVLETQQMLCLTERRVSFDTIREIILLDG